MSAQEVKSSLALASIFGLRLFGMFVILPVFALWASGRPGWTLELAGVAMGAYGLTQGLLQMPYGWLSDRVGRKPMLYLGLALFALGSFICAFGESPWVMILGRVVQGTGAVSGVAIATVADLTRESQRTKAMAIVGSTIGVVFAVSFVVAPFLEQAIGVPGIFAVTGVLVICSLAVVRWLVPDAPAGRSAASVSGLGVVFRDAELLRLYVGIFVLHAVLMAMFVVVPVALVRAGLPAAEHSWVYLGAVAAGFAMMVPFVVGRASTIERPVFLVCIGSIGVALALLCVEISSLPGIIAALVIFFAGFNVLEAKLPSLVSRAAPRESTGTATGVYSSVQFFGTFFGAAGGGAIAQHGGFVPVLVTCLAITAAWFAVAWSMGDFLPAASPASRT
ncbi:MAG: MFS transporter [Usitatibacter sp.]